LTTFCGGNYTVPKYKPLVRFSEQQVESLLEKVITEMIAKDLNIRPEEVTQEFMQKWRDEHLYPKGNVELKSLYGGYNPGGRRVLTQAEIDSFKKEAEAFFRKTTTTRKS
jgi:hypothetical protein